MRIFKPLFIVVNILLLTSSLYSLYGASYNILSVTPLFFLNFPLLFLAILFNVITLILFNFTTRCNKILSIIVALTLYYIVLYLPFFSLKFSIYNDQLGFAIETFYGYITGYVAPYQGEYTTLGHAYFTTVLGKLLGLELYNVVKYEEAVFVFISFLTYLSFVIKFIKKRVTGGIANLLLAVATLLAFPSFALEPLVYSRGYFGLILGIVLFMCTFTFIESRKISDSIISTIVFVSSSISYPLQPLILVFSMAMLIFISWFLGLLKKNMAYSKLKLLILKVLYFFVIWTSIQVFYGYGVWRVFHEIIFKVLQQEYFTALEYPALKYVGDASVYINLRMIMMASAWIISMFIASILLLKILRLKVSSHVEQFALSIMATILLLGAAYGVTYHEPATRFYRTLVAVIPFALLSIGMPSIRTDITKFSTNRSALKKVLIASLLLTLSIFLILSPIIKWGWTFIGYPTISDVELANYIAFHHMASYGYVYAPGSHQLLDFIFKINVLPPDEIKKEAIKGGGDFEFNLDKANSLKYTATFYRIYILPRWTGKDVKAMLIRIYDFSTSNNLIYSNGGLHLLVENRSSVR